MELCALTMGKVEDFLETIPSKHARKNYVTGLRKFEQWYGDSITQLIKNPDATKTVEKFYVALKQKHPQNTCRNVDQCSNPILESVPCLAGGRGGYGKIGHLRKTWKKTSSNLQNQPLGRREA